MELRRPGVLRVLEQAVCERLLAGGPGIPHDAGHQTTHRLQHDHRRHLTAVEHEVSDRELAIDEVLSHTLVDPLVASADQGEPREGGKLASHCLIEAPTGGTEQEQGPRWVLSLHRGEDRLRLQDHSRPTPEGGVIDRSVDVRGVDP